MVSVLVLKDFVCICFITTFFEHLAFPHCGFTALVASKVRYRLACRNTQSRQASAKARLWVIALFATIDSLMLAWPASMGAMSTLLTQAPARRMAMHSAHFKNSPLGNRAYNARDHLSIKPPLHPAAICAACPSSRTMQNILKANWD